MQETKYEPVIETLLPVSVDRTPCFLRILSILVKWPLVS